MSDTFNMTLPTDVDAEAATAAILLEQHPDYRVLRRIGEPGLLAKPVASADGATRVGVAIDVETTGRDPAKDVVIEVAIQRFRFDAEGQITQVGAVRTWREDPGFALPAQISRITGLTDADLAGQVIDTDAATQLLKSADIVIAHNAGFDRPFVEARLPAAAALPWGCSLREVDWEGLGFEGRSLSALLMQLGLFYPPHRAEIDVSALLHLLAHCCHDGERILAKLVAKAERPSVRVEARSTDYAQRHMFKDRGYAWDAPNKSWWIEVNENEVESEQLWFQRAGGLRAPLLTPVTWRERYR